MSNNNISKVYTASCFDKLKSTKCRYCEKQIMIGNNNLNGKWMALEPARTGYVRHNCRRKK